MIGGTSSEHQLRKFLLGTTGAIFVGTVIELVLVEHTADTVQWIPFILSGLGLFTVLAAWMAPFRGMILTLRGVMVVMVGGGFYGIYEHFQSNLAFAMEINPGIETTQAIIEALYGANPMMAPGIFCLAGLLGLFATYRHPAV